MIKRLSALALFCVLAIPLLAQRQGPFTITSTTGPNSCATIQVNPNTSSTVGIQVTGTWVATLQPGVSIAKQAYVNTAVTPTGSSTAQGTVTANGVYSGSVAGVDSFQLCATAYSSGTATVYLTVSQGSAGNRGGGGGGTGTPGGSPGQVQANAGGGNFSGFTVSGDATLNTTTGVEVNTGINGGSVPASATVLGTNSSSQPVAASTSGTGAVALVNGPTFIGPNLGTPATGNLANTTGFPVSALGNATGTHTVLFGNSTQTWNCVISGSNNCLEIGESGTSTGSGYLLNLTTVGGSTLAGLNISMAGATNFDGLTLGNPTAATLGLDQNSPKLLFKANGFGSGASAVDTFLVNEFHGASPAHQPILQWAYTGSSGLTPVFNLAGGMNLSLGGSSSGSSTLSVGATGGVLSISGPLSVTAGNITTNMSGGPFCVHETSGVLSATAADCGTGSSGLSGMTAGQVALAATASTVTSSKAIQGTDTSLLSSGTIAGTAAALCTDANGGATTTGCPSGGFTPGNNISGSSTSQIIKSIGPGTGLASPLCVVDGTTFTTIAGCEAYLVSLGFGNAGVIWSFFPERFTSDPFVNFPGNITLFNQSASGNVNTCTTSAPYTCWLTDVPLTLPTHLTLTGVQNPSRSQGPYNQGTVIAPSPTYVSPLGVPTNATSWTGTGNHIPDFSCVSTGGSLSNGNYWVTVWEALDRTGGVGTSGSTSATRTPGFSAPTQEIKVACGNGTSTQSITFHAPTASGSGAFVAKDFYVGTATAANINGAGQEQANLVTTQWTCGGCGASYFENSPTFGFGIPGTNQVATIISVPTLTSQTGFAPPLVDLSTCFIAFGTGVPGYSVNGFDVRLQHMTLSAAMNGTNTTVPAANEPSCAMLANTAQENSGPEDIVETGPWIGTTLYEGYKAGNSFVKQLQLPSNDGPSPAVVGPFAVTSVNTTGVYTGTFTGCAANACAGPTNKYTITGFPTNPSNNLVNAQAVASDATHLDFSTTTIAETHAATVAGPFFYPTIWDGRGLGNGGARTFEDSTVANRCLNCSSSPVEPYSTWMVGTTVGLHAHAIHFENSDGGDGFFVDNKASLDASGITGFADSGFYLAHATATADVFDVFITKVGQNGAVSDDSVPFTKTVAANVGYEYNKQMTASTVVLAGFTGGSTSPICPNGTGGALTTSGCAGSSTTLSSILAATGSNTIANGNNGLQIWNWAPTTNQNLFQLGETTAATSGTLGSQYILSAKTLAGSTAVPFGVIGSLTGSQTLPTLHITPTWNTSGVVDAALLVNVTNTASGTGSLLFDTQVGGASQFKVDKAGNATAATSLAVGAPAGGVGSSLFLSQEGTVPGSLSAAGQDNCYSDSTQHGLLCNFNAGSTLPLVQGPASSTNGDLASLSGTNGGKIVDSNVIAANVVTQTSNAAANQICTYTGANKVCVPATTLPTAAVPAFTGAITNSAGALATSPGKVDVTNANAFCADAGASDSYACNLSPAITAYVTGTHYRFKANTANVGAASINFNAVGAITIVKVAGGITTTLANNDILVGQWVDLVYDGTNMQMQSLLGNTPAGGVSSVNTLTGAVVIEAATAGQMAVSGGSGAALTGAADMTYSTHTFATTTAGIFDWSAATGTNSFKFPAVIGATAMAGTSTANLSSPFVLTNTNSSNNNTSITAGFTAPGTSTGQTVVNINNAATGGDFLDLGTGGTWTNGVLSGQTIVDSFGITGLTKFGAGPAIVAGTGGGFGFGCGTAPTGVASNGVVYCDAANQLHAMSGTTDQGIVATQSQTAQLTADWTCGTGGTAASCVAAQTIGTLTFTFPLEAKNWSFACDLIVGQATAATANNWTVQTATNGATNLMAGYTMNTAATAVTSGAVTGVASTTTATDITGTWTLGGTATKMPVHIYGTVEGASASGTVLNLMLKAPTVGDLVTIYRGSACRIF